MKLWKCFLTVCFLMVAPAVFCDLQEDFTASDNGTLPSTLDAEWDAGVDVIVTDLATAGVPSDHVGGDGYVLRVGDLAAGGYNFAFPANYQTVSATDGQVEAWAYFDFDGMSAERDYGVFLRCNPDPTPDSGGKAVYGDRHAYWFFVTANSSWGTYVPGNYHAFILKRTPTSGGWVQLGSEGTGTYGTGWHRLVLAATGSLIEGYVDGNLEVSATDTDIAAGFGGMVYYDDNDINSAGAFDNFLWTGEGALDVKDWMNY